MIGWIRDRGPREGLGRDLVASRSISPQRNILMLSEHTRMMLDSAIPDHYCMIAWSLAMLQLTTAVSVLPGSTTDLYRQRFRRFAPWVPLGAHASMA